MKNISGKKFGSWTVLNYVRSGRYIYGERDSGIYHVWLCVCNCGKQQEVRAGNLIQGKTTRCRSCNALFNLRKKKQHNITSKILLRMKYRSKKKGYQYTVTPLELFKIYKNQNGRCALSGVPITFDEYAKDEATASPDRIDPTRGYVKGNVRWVHKYINSMRNNKTDNEFVLWCKLVVEHNSSFSK